MRRTRLGLLVLALLLVFYLVTSHNGLVGADQRVRTAWSQVENQLQRRYDLIPNLVSTVRAYAQHEQEVFTAVADARARLAGARSVDETAAATDALEGVLGRLLVVVEAYPELKASASFIALQDELAGTENRLAVARMRYNELVQSYNVRARSVPTVFLVGLLGFEREKPFFEVQSDSARRAPPIGF